MGIDIYKILQIVTDNSFRIESLSDDKWFDLFKEIGYGSDEFYTLFDKIPDLGEVIIRKLLKCKCTGFFTIDSYFQLQLEESECVHSLDDAEYFSPESVSDLPSDLCLEVTQYLVHWLDWYTPDGYNAYKYKSDYDRLDEEEEE